MKQVRKCKAAEQGLCYNCDTVCVACGTKRFSVFEGCALCMYCESGYPIKQKDDKEQLINLIIVKEAPKDFIKEKGN